jgi:hypothetical protein
MNTMSKPADRQLYLGFIGCLAGAALAWFPSLLIMQKGVLSTFLIGAASGIVGRCALGRRHHGVASFAAVLTFVAATLCHWHFAPFVFHPGLVYFVTHISDLSWKIWVDMSFGTFLAYYIVSHRIPNDK